MAASGKPQLPRFPTPLERRIYAQELAEHGAKRSPGSLRKQAEQRAARTGEGYYQALYQVRMERGTAAGYGKRQAVGHPRKGELRISVDKAIKIIKNPGNSKAEKIKAGRALNRYRRTEETRHELWTRMVFSPPRQGWDDLEDEEPAPS
jgi:hypothetical protein